MVINPIPTSQKSYIKDQVWAESAHALTKSNLVIVYHIESFHLFALIAQLIEHQTCNLEVVSLIPSFAQNSFPFFPLMRSPKSEIVQKQSNL